jgi:hypothetical protein
MVPGSTRTCRMPFESSGKARKLGCLLEAYSSKLEPGSSRRAGVITVVWSIQETNHRASDRIWFCTTPRRPCAWMSMVENPISCYSSNDKLDDQARFEVVGFRRHPLINKPLARMKLVFVWTRENSERELQSSI